MKMRKELLRPFRGWLNPSQNRWRGQSLNCIHSIEEFQLVLQRERIRTERTGLEFSLVVFDIGNTNDHSTYAESLINLLSQRVRLMDEVGWFDKRNIGAILPSTSAEGARKFANDISQKVALEGRRIAYNIYTYPIIRLNDGGESLKKLPSPDLTPRPVEGVERLLVRRISLLKRGIDIMGSTIGLFLFLPVMLTAAIAIKLTSRGPIFFKQERIGLLGKRFNFLKFRSMVVNQNSDIHKHYIENFIKNGVSHGEHREGDECYKIKDDPRVTLVGKFLRKTSMDELPQLINVLKGEMSLVGPRPPIPYECEYYENWHNRRILGIRPGITGLWQVRGRSRMTFEEMVRQDLKYISEWSFWLDIKILLHTPWAVFSGKGAY